MKLLKPGYDSEAVQAKLVEEICDYFGRVFDDDEQERHSLLRGHRPGDEKWTEIMGNDPTINETARNFDISPNKVRKLLITGKMYDTEQYREISELKRQGKAVGEIAEELELKPAVVRSYLPYERVIYNLEERSVTADRMQRFKKRHGGYKAKELAEERSSMRQHERDKAVKFRTRVEELINQGLMKTEAMEKAREEFRN